MRVSTVTVVCTLDRENYDEELVNSLCGVNSEHTPRVVAVAAAGEVSWRRLVSIVPICAQFVAKIVPGMA
jgi:hypothetical protein